jgi:sulfatase modifying factor 1
MNCHFFLLKCRSASVVTFLALGLSVVAFLSGTPSSAITIDMVTVGDLGNTNDPRTGSIHGSVPYAYRIGSYAVTINQYTSFLNAADPTGANVYALYDVQSTGIGFDGNASNGSKYVMYADPNLPATRVSWFSAARFANWVMNGQGGSSTETGAYTLNGRFSGDAVARNPGATYYIPTTNEWYKAAYFSPHYGGPGVPGYYTYAVQSDTLLGNVVGGSIGHANYYNGMYAVTQSSEFDSNQIYLTPVGAFTNSASYYGTWDQSGNVWQWNDLDGTSGPYRSLRGGTWNNVGVDTLTSSASIDQYPADYRGYDVGFRLASPLGVPPSSVPEIDPSGYQSVVSLLIGALGLLERRRLRRAGAER